MATANSWLLQLLGDPGSVAEMTPPETKRRRLTGEATEDQNTQQNESIRAIAPMDQGMTAKKSSKPTNRRRRADLGDLIKRSMQMKKRLVNGYAEWFCPSASVTFSDVDYKFFQFLFSDLHPKQFVPRKYSEACSIITVKLTARNAISIFGEAKMYCRKLHGIQDLHPREVIPDGIRLRCGAQYTVFGVATMEANFDGARKELAISYDMCKLPSIG